MKILKAFGILVLLLIAMICFNLYNTHINNLKNNRRETRKLTPMEELELKMKAINEQTAEIEKFQEYAKTIEPADSSITTSIELASKTKDYPYEFIKNFIKNCATAPGNNYKMCSCLFNKVSEKYTYKESTEIEAKMADGQMPADFKEFVRKSRLKCSKN